ncbi:hypothetical protein ACFQRD_10010 [Brachybacterium sp. GCM10030268]
MRRLLGGRQYNPPTWSLLRRTITIRPLGGVRPGPDAETGVVDEIGALLRGLTTLSTEVSPADSADGESLRTFPRIDLPDLVRLLASIRGQGFPRPRRLTAAGRFAGFFVRSAVARPRRQVAART